MLVVGSIVIRVDDLDAQIEFSTRALDYVSHQSVEVDYVVMGPDPKGNRFCVIDASTWPGWETVTSARRP